MLSSDFEYQRVDVEGVTVNCAVAGSGSPVLLLHGQDLVVGSKQ